MMVIEKLHRCYPMKKHYLCYYNECNLLFILNYIWYHNKYKKKNFKNGTLVVISRIASQSIIENNKWNYRYVKLFYTSLLL